MLTRRNTLKGLAGILLAGAAPFYVPARDLMRVKPIVAPTLRRYRWAFYALDSDGEILSERQIVTESGSWKIPLPNPKLFVPSGEWSYLRVEGPVNPNGRSEDQWDRGLPGVWFSYTVDRLKDLALCPRFIA